MGHNKNPPPKAPLMQKFINRILGKTRLVRDLRARLEALNQAHREAQAEALSNAQAAVRLEAQRKAQGAFEAGHYYSPIPSRDEVNAYLAAREPAGAGVAGIDLNARGQRQLLDQYAAFYRELPFPERKEAGRRYFYENDWFSYSDAIFLYCFLRKFQPRRIIEVGSGFSSAAMLDTVDEIDAWAPEMTFIEPYPERLNSLLSETDRKQVNLIDSKIQDVSPETFSMLGAGDFLFVDSSHVVKCGSDLQLLLFEVLPALPPGVFVHFHDVFYPFDYPAEWLEEGRYWNENYFLRAFLSYNAEWRIVFFNTFVNLVFGERVAEKMPLCARNRGGSLYIQRHEGSTNERI